MPQENFEKNLPVYESIANEIVNMLDSKNITPYEAVIIISTLAAALETFAFNNPDAFANSTLKQLMKGSKR